MATRVTRKEGVMIPSVVQSGRDWFLVAAKDYMIQIEYTGFAYCIWAGPRGALRLDKLPIALARDVPSRSKSLIAAVILARELSK